MKCMNLYSLLLVVLIFVSCGSSNDASGMIAPTVNVSPTQVSATYEGVVTKLSITSDQEWTAFSGERSGSAAQSSWRAFPWPAS